MAAGPTRTSGLGLGIVGGQGGLGPGAHRLVAAVRLLLHWYLARIPAPLRFSGFAVQRPRNLAAADVFSFFHPHIGIANGRPWVPLSRQDPASRRQACTIPG